MMLLFLYYSLKFRRRLVPVFRYERELMRNILYSRVSAAQMRVQAPDFPRVHALFVLAFVLAQGQQLCGRLPFVPGLNVAVSSRSDFTSGSETSHLQPSASSPNTHTHFCTDISRSQAAGAGEGRVSQDRRDALDMMAERRVWYVRSMMFKVLWQL